MEPFCAQIIDSISNSVGKQNKMASVDDGQKVKMAMMFVVMKMGKGTKSKNEITPYISNTKSLLNTYPLLV